MKSVKPCIVCGGTKSRPLYPRLEIAKCAECQFVFADRKIDPRKIYTADDFQGEVYADYEK